MTAVNAVTDLSFTGDVAVITLDSPPVNAMSAAVITGLHDGFQAAIDSNARAVVLICAGRTFIAGADITSFSAGGPSGPLPGPTKDLMEASPKPIVAAIHGTALGGGLELALCAHYRVAVPSAKLGLPEVSLGLLPGGGGTQRLPRLVGAAKALDLMTSGRQVSAAEALELGLLDALMTEGGLREGAVAYAGALVVEGRSLKRIRDLDDKVVADRGHPEIFADFRKAGARRFRGFKAPEAIVRAVEAAVALPFDQGMAEERRLFLELMASPESAAQRYGFFIQRAAQKIPGVAADTPTLPIRRVGIIGAGTMGGGIAMNFANAGIPVTIVEMAQANLDRSLGVIAKNYAANVARGGVTQAQADERVGLLTGSLKMEALADADLVIEAVFEDMALKKEVFRKLDAICRPDAILATNTSYLDVDEIAAPTRHPDRVLGLHFFSPANVMKLLEIVRGRETSKPVVATAVKLAKQIGKVGVVVGVCHGFVGNRMLSKRQGQANSLVLEGADFAAVDRVLYDFGFPMGPYAMNDLVGLDVIKDPPGQPSLRGTLAAAGRLGQKGGGGFYDYDEKRQATPSPVAEEIIAGYRSRAGVISRPISDAEIRERTLYAMINEGLKILEEGIAIRPSDIDVVWQNGYGWPVYKGGPMYYADKVVGLPTLLDRLKSLEAAHGADFAPAALLERLVAAGETLSDWKTPDA